MNEVLDFGGVRIASTYRARPVLSGELETCAWTGLDLGSTMPNMIELRITADATTDVVPYTIFGSKARRLNEPFTLQVPVKWNNYVPHTRQRGVDNVDIILMSAAKDGHYVDVQVSLVTRANDFFVCAQEVWAGWTARTRGGQIAFVPSESRHNYPGSNYAEIWRGMAAELERIAREIGVTTRRSRVAGKAPEWAPRWANPETGWIHGVVVYFNAVTGTGIVMDPSGQLYFVHFGNILEHDLSGMVMLDPESPVLFRADPPSAGERLPKVRYLKHRISNAAAA